MFHRTLKVVDDDFYYQEGADSGRAALKKRRSWLSPKRITLAALILLAMAAGGWIYARRPVPVVMASYAPETALGYLEINNWPKLIDNLIQTEAWRELAPAFGVPARLDNIGKIGAWPFGDLLARLGGRREAAILARSQFAIVITGLEARGEQVKPQMALIVETHSAADALREIAEKRLSQFAENAFGRFVKETDEYAGIPISIYRAGDSDKRLLVAQIDGELILANFPDTLHDCIDTRLGRAPSMINNFHLRNARPLVEPDEGQSAMFGFVTGEGVTRLMRFWAFLISGDMFSKAAMSGQIGEVFNDFSARATDGIAYGASFENGSVVDRYTLLLKPDLADAIKNALKTPKQNERNADTRRVLDLIPDGAGEVTLIGVENPTRALDGIEAAISARVGAAQSFLLHQFLINGLDLFLGLKENEKADGVVGDEIASFNMTGEAKDRVWLIALRDESFIMTLIERVFTSRGAKLSNEQYKGYQMYVSSDPRHGAAAIIGDFLALGSKERLTQLIDAYQSGRNFSNSPRVAASDNTRGPVAVKSFSSVKEESGEMLSAIARWVGRPQSKAPELDRLNLAMSGATINDRGVYVESRSPFGNFPFIINLAEGMMASGSENK